MPIEPAPNATDLPARTSRPRTAPEPRWVTLWRELARTRERLAAHERRAGAVETLFRTRIEPRERLLTLGAVRIGEALVEHYEETGLARAERSLLGLWVNEHLESLAAHPYAPREPVADLIRRWRAVLGGADDAPPDPADPESPGYRTMPVKLDAATRERAERDAISRYLGALFERGDGVRVAHERDEPGPVAAERTEARSSDVPPGPFANADAPRGADSGAGSGADPGADRSPDRKARSGAGRVAGSNDSGDVHALIERLFRRLARALHPDREPDPTRREIKHVLMSTSLAARRARDLDTLLSLHTEHVGELPDALGAADAEALAVALERQLRGMRRALDRARDGDPFRTELLNRYDGADDAARARRVADHASRLDAETARLERLASTLATADGLQDALDDRRELERDRLSIDELTGG